ncbi:hypothetical protein CBR_g12385 [Chara braunii]|uniref:Uncharacterized protein n=1 Tax=Chara braunii TaxID=69332 RepID=A0A388KS43_CHABU|nr:hypothetical protein CBR_g12385 [Chara braunii]|eukprot:GBG72818.1 hypothetical protein CBR_g12385 [Chara braunii]
MASVVRTAVLIAVMSLVLLVIVLLRFLQFLGRVWRRGVKEGALRSASKRKAVKVRGKKGSMVRLTPCGSDANRGWNMPMGQQRLTPVAYVHLPSYLQPLPDDDMVDLSTTGSFSSQLESDTGVRLSTSATEPTECFTSLSLVTPRATRANVNTPARSTESTAGGDGLHGGGVRICVGSSAFRSLGSGSASVFNNDVPRQPSTTPIESGRGSEGPAMGRGNYVIPDDMEGDGEPPASPAAPAQSATGRPDDVGQESTGVAREKGDADAAKADSGRRVWDNRQSLILIHCKRDQEQYFAGLPSNFGRMKSKDWKWLDIEKRMEAQGVIRAALKSKERRDNLKGFKFFLDRELWDAIRAGQDDNQTINPTNRFTDTGKRPADNADSEGEEGEDMSTDCASASQGSRHGKKKTAREQTFAVVGEVMKEYSTVVAESVDRASKRQCEFMDRQCTVLERELYIHEWQLQLADVGQKLLCDALMKIAETLSKP